MEEGMGMWVFGLIDADLGAWAAYALVSSGTMTLVSGKAVVI